MDVVCLSLLPASLAFSRANCGFPSKAAKADSSMSMLTFFSPCLICVSGLSRRVGSRPDLAEI